MRVRVLGPLQLDGTTSSLGPRDRVVLEALAVQPGRVLGADALADALWGQAPPARWPKGVQCCVVLLRRALGANAIVTEAAGYRLALAASDLDAAEFERLIERGRA